MFTLKGAGSEGSGPGIVRVSGSFTTNGSNAVVLTRPSKGDFTITRVTTGVYQFTYQQAALSVLSAGIQIGPTAAYAAAGGLDSKPPAFPVVSQDFMVTNAGGSAYAADSTNKNLVMLLFTNTAGTLVDVYTLGNSSSAANYRISFDISLCTTAMNQ